MSIIHNNAKLSNSDFFIGILILKSRHNRITITSTIERKIKCLRYFFSYSFKCIVLINNTPSYMAVLPSSLGGCGTGVGAGVTGSVGSEGSGSGVTSVSLPSVVGGVSTCILHT